MWYRRLQRKCRWVALSGLLLICIFSYYLLVESIPDRIHIVAGREEQFNLKLPVTGEIVPGEIPVLVNQNSTLEAQGISINMQDSFVLSSSQQGSFSIQCKLFGLISLKEVSVEVIDQQKVVPCGTAIGIYVKTDGILVIGTSAVTGMDGMNYQPAENLLKSGDYIKTVNGQQVTRKEELVDLVNTLGGSDLVLGLVRDEIYTEIRIKPVQTALEEYKIGAWVRDDLAGVGTMTYHTADLSYGALGHPVSDADTSTKVTLDEGKLYEAAIVGITKGEKGKPGALSGVIDYQPRYCLGTVSGNVETGIYGVLDRLPQGLEQEDYVEIGLKQELELGEAVIISAISGERREYQVQITNLDYNGASENKGIELEVTDPELLSLTGGIVQGMSGSPILQKGKLVGAVTHVFVNDPTMGYGIFIENMLKEFE